MRRLLSVMLVASLAAGKLSAQQRHPAAAEQAREMSRYVGWGMTIGAGGGLVYALMTAKRDRTFGLVTIGYAGLGGAIGMAGGAIVYFVRLASRR